MSEATSGFYNPFTARISLRSCGLKRPVVLDEDEEFHRLKRRRRSFATTDLPDDMVQAIGSSRMDERHAHLDAVLESK
jgi:hypothetical protein